MAEVTKRKLSDEMIESLIIKGVMHNKQYLTILMNAFEPKYFDKPLYQDIYKKVIGYYKDHMSMPEELILKDMIKDNPDPDLTHLDDLDFDIIKNYDLLITETNLYLKEKAVKQAIMDAVDIVDKGDDMGSVKKVITDALSKDLLINLGLNYWDTTTERLKEIASAVNSKTPSYFPMLDELINGGFPPYTLSLFLSRIHGGKTNLLVNMIQRMSDNGKNVIMFSMEMGENALAQRLDSINTLSDINRMYTSPQEIVKLAKQLKANKSDKGTIIIKEFPTGQASTSHFKSVLREYQYRGIEFDAIFCDYITIMMPEYNVVGQLYQDGKRISEELRALSLEFMSPVISVSQLNREGIFIDFKAVDMQHIGESLGISSSCDFMAIMGKDEDSLVYESELAYKIVKNRLGGRIGETSKLYLDKKSLKVYCETELDQWISDATITSDERKTSQKY
jgi:replicative DNA helicase